MKWIGRPPFRPLPGLALAAPHRDPLPLKQAAELESVSRSQHTQHLIQIHLRLAHVQVLQGCGEGWGGERGASTETEPSVWGSAPRVPPHSQAPRLLDALVPAGWVATDAIGDTAQAPSLAEEIGMELKETELLPEKRSREPDLGVRGPGFSLHPGPWPVRGGDAQCAERCVRVGTIFPSGDDI